MGVTAVIVGAALSAGGAAASVENGKNQVRAMDQASTVAQQKQDALDAQAKQQQQTQESQAAATQTRDAAKNRQAQLTAGANGVSSTILTSPLGIQTSNSQPAGQKTLLGA